MAHHPSLYVTYGPAHKSVTSEEITKLAKEHDLKIERHTNSLIDHAPVVIDIAVQSESLINSKRRNYRKTNHRDKYFNLCSSSPSIDIQQ